MSETDVVSRVVADVDLWAASGGVIAACLGGAFVALVVGIHVAVSRPVSRRSDRLFWWALGVCLGLGLLAGVVAGFAERSESRRWQGEVVAVSEGTWEMVWVEAPRWSDKSGVAEVDGRLVLCEVRSSSAGELLVVCAGFEPPRR